MSSVHRNIPLLIAHRGDANNFQENTLEAFLSAFEKGADGVELDIHFHNGEVVVVHDFLFDSDQRYPMLEDILRKISSKGRVEIEVKSFDVNILPPLEKILDNYPEADLELTTSEIPLAIHIKKSFPQIPLGLIIHDFFFQDWMTSDIAWKKLIGWGVMTKSDRLHVPLQTLDQFGQASFVEKLQASEFVVHSHIHNTDDQIEELALLARWGVDQCTFDDITLLESITD